ncbi:MAG: glutamine-hydrolyzing carbamoyl-phosphate synthase small subunit [Elusimicrobia bacterium]|nr:glutamine-hydrolyzing carbamoyl-phosphate synthase small subunit [Elusimicrobiota bacterium]
MTEEPSPAATLTLSDGGLFSGTSFGAPVSVEGEVVFNTGMVGYPEALTDPSYRGQILVLTHPMAGNYGVPARGRRDRHGLPEGFESERIQVRGLVVTDVSESFCHWSAVSSLHDWLAEQGVPGLSGVDTRALAKRLRHVGVMPGRLGPANLAVRPPDAESGDYVAEVSCREVRAYGSEGPTIMAVDCGMKANILRCLLKAGAKVVRVPWDHDFAAASWDGLFLSNGPGDPKRCGALVQRLRAALALDRPVFGICLGSQLLALAAGGDTYKLKYGHRGQNQPCVDADTGRCFITSQNHGYAVAPESLPAGWKVWLRNGNDQTVEGLRHADKPFRGVQFHPEANPGPTDTAFLFDRFISQARACRT